MQAWPLTGRAEELDVIADVLSANGPYTGVVIAGSAGVGKTRLAREAMALAAARGWAVRWFTGTAAAQSIPLGACAQWADRLSGDPLQLVGAVIAELTESPSGAPVLVVVDDARLLDNLSAFVLHQLALRRAATVIATIRTGAPAPDAVTALWKDGHLRRLDLQPLSRGESDALLRSALDRPVSPACAERMWHLTRGNVLFLHQLVNQELQAGRLTDRDGTWHWVGIMEVSQSLVDLVDLRIGAAPEPVLEVIDLVAVAEPLELAYLSALADATVIEDAERRGLITVSRTRPNSVARLSHPLFGEVRLALAGQLRLERLRGCIALKMSSRTKAADAPDPVRLALLWLQSDLDPDPEVLTRAAQAAYGRLDVALAQRLSEAAVRAGAGVGAELLCANTLTMLSLGAEAEELLESLTARRLPEPAWSTAVILRAVNLLWPLGQPAQSCDIIDEALVGAAASVSQRLLTCRAVQLAVAGEPRQALSVCESINRAELTALPALILAWAQTIACGDHGYPQQAALIADDAAPVAAASPEVAYYHAVILVVYQVQALVVGGYLAQAQAAARCIYQQCADVPGIAQTFATAIRGEAALATGDLNTAIECLRTAVAQFADRGDRAGHFGIDYTEALARAGDVDGAIDALAQMRRNQHPAHAYREPDRLVAAAWVAAAGGRNSEACRSAREGAELARIRGQHAREVLCLQAAIQFGDPHTAPRLAELAALVDGPRAELAARWAAGLADHDSDALLAVSHALESMGDRIASADAAAHASRVFHQHNQRGPALTASGRAERLINECGATTPATLAAAMPLPLTDREREIAVLISKGLSNNEIAQSLTLSVRTIEGHIYRACARVGAPTKTELGRLVGEFVSSRNTL